MRRVAIVLALLVSVFAFAGSARAETPIPPAPTRWVTDTSGLLTPATLAALDARLEAYDHATGRQVIVWIGTTLGDSPVDDWCASAFKRWGIGQRGKDNGVAIFVFPTDRETRIEVGYGVEDVLPDAYAARIVDDVMAPAFKAGHPDAAITGAVDQTLSRLGGEPNGVIAAPMSSPPHSSPSLIEIILGIVGVIAILVLAVTHPRIAMLLLWTVMSGLRGGGGGGGGFSGGGGRSGGGGASGGW
jgi:uncharacterized protein